MPCTDGGVPYPEDIREQREQRMVKAALCAVLTQLETQHATNDQNGCEFVLANINYREAGFKRKELETWWNKHKAEDVARRVREATEAEQLNLRRQGLSKLSQAEREALGLTKKWS